ncbi:hypothetical protein GW17_00020997 [Ensete ventricosum]|nr:hypothetical protein GW17_00020997 [Ensete ventricosum]
MCSIGLELSSYASSVENQNFYGIGLSWISRTKGDPVVELSLSSSFDLTNSFWTLSMHRFISRNYALSESIESEERVSGSDIRWVGVLVVGTGQSIAFPGGPEGSFGESCGTSSSGRHRIGGCPCEVGVPVALSGWFVVGVLVTALAEGCGG